MTAQDLWGTRRSDPTGNPMTWRSREVFLPLGVIALALALLPAARVGGALVRMQRRRRRVSQVGRCAVCGYDLRATPERCPECGAVGRK